MITYTIPRLLSGKSQRNVISETVIDSSLMAAQDIAVIPTEKGFYTLLKNGYRGLQSQMRVIKAEEPLFFQDLNWCTWGGVINEGATAASRVHKRRLKVFSTRIVDFWGYVNLSKLRKQGNLA